MKENEENTFWKWVNEKFHEQIEELRKESVERKRETSIAFSRPPAPPALKEKLKK